MTEKIREDLAHKLQAKGVRSYTIKNEISLKHDYEQKPTDLFKDHNIYKLEISFDQGSDELPNQVFQFRIFHNDFREEAIHILNFYQIPHRELINQTYENTGIHYFVGRSSTEYDYQLSEAIRIISDAWENGSKNPEIQKIYEKDFDKISGALLRLKAKENEIVNIRTSIPNITNFNFQIKEDIFKNFDELDSKYTIGLILYHYSLSKNANYQEYERLGEISFKKLLNNLDPIIRSIRYLSSFPQKELSDLAFNRLYLRGKTRTSNYTRNGFVISLYIAISNWFVLSNENKSNLNSFTNNLKMRESFEQIIDEGIQQNDIYNFTNKDTYQMINLFMSKYEKVHYDKWKKDQETKSSKVDPASFEYRDLMFIFSMAKKNDYIKDSINSKNYELTKKGFELLKTED